MAIRSDESTEPGSVAPEFQRLVQGQSAARRGPDISSMTSGDVARPVFASSREAAELMSVAAKRAAGLFRPTKRTEIVWVRGETQLAVGLVGLEVIPADGLITVVIPVRCDQTGPERVHVTFATGSQDAPAGLFAATQARPQGPAIIVEAWGENLVAYAWQCLLGLVSGMAGAVGKDSRGNLLVPAEMVVNHDGIAVVPMSRYRFGNSSGLLTKARDAR